MNPDAQPTIPKIIHQIWYQGSAQIPSNLRAYSDGWKSKHPTWEHRMWDRDSARKLIAEMYPDYLEMWERYPRDIQRIDAARYFILHAHGGIYLDMDIECLKPIDALIQDCAFMLSRTASYNVAVMASTSGHEFWPYMLQALTDAAKSTQYPSRLRRLLGSNIAIYVAQTTGPLLFSSCVEAYELHKMTTTRVCPGHVFEPLAPTIVNGRVTYKNEVSESYAIHHESMQWLSPLSRAMSMGTRQLLKFIYSGKNAA